MEYALKIFSALSDPIRLRALALMAKEGELCVCELTQSLQTSQPKMSKHLAGLRDCGLVRDRRDAQWVLYALTDDLPPWVWETVAAALRGLSDDPVHVEDLARLKTASRPPRIRIA